MIQVDLPDMGAKPPTGPEAGTKNAPLDDRGASLRLCFHQVVFDSPHHLWMKEPPNRRLIWWLCVRVTKCAGCIQRLSTKFSYEDMKNAKKRKSSHKKA